MQLEPWEVPALRCATAGMTRAFTRSRECAARPYRNSRRSTLPTAVFGSGSERNSTMRGTL